MIAYKRKMRQILTVPRRGFRRVMPFKKRYSHVFIVGAQKAGTSALHAYLIQHSQITGGDKKEHHFFNGEYQYVKGEKFYRSQFPVSASTSHALDSTPGYMYSTHAAERIHHYAPDAKIVIVIREPVSRAFSAFNMYSQVCRTKKFLKYLSGAHDDTRKFFLPFSKGDDEPDICSFLDTEIAIINGESDAPEPALIRRGIYAPQIERFISLFGKDNVHVLFNNELKRDTEQTVNKVLQFIGLSPMSDAQYPLRHVRDYTVDSKIKDEIQRRAGAIFNKDRQELIDIYDLQIPW